MNTHPNASHSRRDFLNSLFAGVLGAGILQVARYPSAWAQALSSAATPGQFEIQNALQLMSILRWPGLGRYRTRMPPFL